MNSATSRMVMVSAALGLIGVAVVWRLVTIQVVRQAEYSQRSRAQSVQRVVVKAPRGRILDRNGRELASSVDAGSQRAQLRDGVGGRIYPYGSLAAPVLGSVGRDGYGQGGVELAFERFLRGEDGWSMVQRDAKATKGGQRRYNVDLPSKSSVRGADVFLTIDLDIQTILQAALVQAREKYRAKMVMGMVMDPRTGDVLAMANEPSFDPNALSKVPLTARINRCIAENYEPGSTYKLVSAAAALEERMFAETDVLAANNGVYEIYGEKIRDHEKFAFLTFEGALVHSSNVCFAKIADKLGNEMFYRYTRNFGFGQRTGVQLPGEEAGIVHPVSEWSGRTRVTMAMGQELSATLLQVMSLYGAIANDGVMVQPRILSRIASPTGSTLDSGEVRPVRRVVSAQTSRRLRAMLQAVVDTGTGRSARIEGVAVAGKTGTSQKIDDSTKAYHADRYYTSFMGFAPAHSPALVCGIVLDDPDTCRSGAQSAAPVFQQVVRQIISHPDLAYAERVLEPPAAQEPGKADSARAPRQASVPMVCGLSVAEASRQLAELGVGFEVVGLADTVRFQSPALGSLTSAEARVTLYADQSERIGTGSSARVAVPECRGRDLRDALNMLIVRGLKPYVVGAGTVRQQRPAVGALTREAQVCSLFCSFDG